MLWKFLAAVSYFLWLTSGQKEQPAKVSIDTYRTLKMPTEQYIWLAVQNPFKDTNFGSQIGAGAATEPQGSFCYFIYALLDKLVIDFLSQIYPAGHGLCSSYHNI